MPARRQASRRKKTGRRTPPRSRTGPGRRTAAGSRSARAAGARRPRARGRQERLIVIANRLPISRAAIGGRTQWTPSVGGLVTALEPVLRSMPGVWVGWNGTVGSARVPRGVGDLALRGVALSRAELDGFYHGMSNGTLWPLYHDAIRSPDFQRAWWREYVAVNRRFAAAAARAAAPGDLAWVHDYHLQLVPDYLRRLRPDLRIGFFLHIPFPPEELFAWLPWRANILRGLLGADVVGFHTQAAAHNFSRLCRRYAGCKGSEHRLHLDGRTVTVGAFPIAIDADWFDAQARRPETQRRAAEIRQRIGQGRRIVLSVDRLDYTKGIEQRFAAIGELLSRRITDAQRTVFVQIATPSRDLVPAYAATRNTIERLVGRINGEHSVPGRMPLHYFRRSLSRTELAAYYAAADLMLVTPLCDGMNLVAKEYVACRTSEDGALVLSEFAGAAHELTSALLVNPYDIDGMVEAIAHGLAMEAAEARRRMRAMRRRVQHNNVHRWAGRFIASLRGEHDAHGTSS